MKGYIKTVMITVLEWQPSPHKKNECKSTEKFVSTPGPLLMGRLTTRLITYLQTGNGIRVRGAVILIAIWWLKSERLTGSK
jgi:hypothetical protein